MAKRYYKNKDYKDVSGVLRELMLRTSFRRIPGTAKPEYVDLTEGKLYYVKQDGTVRERRIKPNSEGYIDTKLKMPDGSFKHFKVHRIVGDFIPNRENKPLVHHKGHDRANNRIENLEHATHKENRNR